MDPILGTFSKKKTCHDWMLATEKKTIKNHDSQRWLKENQRLKPSPAKGKTRVRSWHG